MIGGTILVIFGNLCVIGCAANAYFALGKNMSAAVAIFCAGSALSSWVTLISISLRERR